MADVARRSYGSGDDQVDDYADLFDLLVHGRPPWWSQAACRQAGPELDWFADDPASVEAVVDVCRVCPARLDCLDWTAANRPTDGVWAGMSPADRRLVFPTGDWRRRPRPLIVWRPALPRPVDGDGRILPRA
jgi:WhiB family redox-sensing transcriptional regulator